MRNKWIDMWMELSRGQRRAVVVLLCVIAMLCVAQVVAWQMREHHRETTADYSVLEQEITRFRSQLDTVPVENRPPVYVRRTHARPDTTQSLHIKSGSKKKKERTDKTKSLPRGIEDNQRIDVP